MKVLTVFGTRYKATTARATKLVGIFVAKIISEVTSLLTDIAAYDSMNRAHNPYDDGKACQCILDTLFQGN